MPVEMSRSVCVCVCVSVEDCQLSFHEKKWLYSEVMSFLLVTSSFLYEILMAVDGIF